jgi:hypothetical protein
VYGTLKKLGVVERIFPFFVSHQQTTQQQVVHIVAKTADQLPVLGQNKSMLPDSDTDGEENINANE